MAGTIQRYEYPNFPSGSYAATGRVAYITDAQNIRILYVTGLVGTYVAGVSISSDGIAEAVSIPKREVASGYIYIYT